MKSVKETKQRSIPIQPKIHKIAFIANKPWNQEIMDDSGLKNLIILSDLLHKEYKKEILESELLVPVN